MFAKNGNELVKIYFKDIVFISGAKEYASIHLMSRRILVYKRMKEFENILPDLFIRIHNSYIINTTHIQRIDKNYIVIGSKNIPISQTYRSRIKDFVAGISNY